MTGELPAASEGEAPATWRPWAPIRNRVAAEYAVKMSALPTFLLAASLLVFSLLIGLPDHVILISVALSLAMMLCALLLRAGKIIWFFPSFVLGLFGSVTLVLANAKAFIGAPLDSGIRGLLGLVLGLIYIALAINGARGWLWLRAHRSPG